VIYNKEDKKISENPENTFQLIYGLENPTEENIKNEIHSKISVCDYFYLPIINKHIPDKSIKTVLEFGSGLGVMANYLSPQFKKYICIDINKHYLSECKRYTQKHNNIEYFLLKDYFFTGVDIKNRSIDIIKATNVFIHLHLYEIIIYLNKFFYLLKEQGLLLFDIFDSDQLEWNSNIMVEHINNHKRGGNYTFAFKPISSSEVKKELNKMGLELIYEAKNGQGGCTLGFKKLTKIL